MFRYIQFLLSFVQFMFSSIQHRIIWLHWFIFCTNSAYFCIVERQKQEWGECNCIICYTVLKRVGGLDPWVTAFNYGGHPSIWAWFDNKHLTPASLLAFSLQPSKGPGSSNLDLHDFYHFSEVFCFIYCPRGLTSTYLKIHQTLEMKEREIRRKTWLVQQMAITPGKLQRRKQTCHHGYWKVEAHTNNLSARVM